MRSQKGLNIPPSAAVVVFAGGMCVKKAMDTGDRTYALAAVACALFLVGTLLLSMLEGWPAFLLCLCAWLAGGGLAVFCAVHMARTASIWLAVLYVLSALILVGSLMIASVLILPPIIPKPDDDMTALMRAAGGGDTETVKALLEAGADLDAADKFGRTALMHAAKFGHVEVVPALLAAGADVDAADKAGRTALMWAVYSYDFRAETARALIAAGADVKARDKAGMTALMWAAQAGNTMTARALVEAGADVNAADNKGMTALMIAKKNGHAYTAQAIKDAARERAGRG